MINKLRNEPRANHANYPGMQLEFVMWQYKTGVICTDFQRKNASSLKQLKTLKLVSCEGNTSITYFIGIWRKT